MISTRGIHASALAITGIVVLILTGSARAFPGQAGARAMAAAAGASPYATQIAELRAVRTLLEQADHDYQGHRAAAVKLITAAIHALHPPKPNASRATSGAAATHRAGAKQATPKGGNEPQAVSDAQLKQALVALTNIQSQLAGAQGTAAATAAAELQKAVQELQTALSIK